MFELPTENEIQFKHLSQSRASIGGIIFPFDPESVSWSFEAKTSVTHTVGGKVVQVLGSNITDMRISGSYGTKGYAGQKRFIESLTRLAKKQKDQVPIQFKFPARDWEFLVFITDISNPDGGRSGVVKPDIVNPRWTLTLKVVRENAGLTKLATNQYIKRLSEGIGWKISAYNGGDEIMPEDALGLPSLEASATSDVSSTEAQEGSLFKDKESVSSAFKGMSKRNS